MTELPPIIERLDAANYHESDENYVELCYELAPELRDMVLRLQEERDHALGANQMYRLEMGQAFDDIKAERDALLEALKAIAYPEYEYRADCPLCGHPIEGHAQDSRVVGCCWKDVEPGATVICGCRELRPELIARAALPEITNVEGKDG